MPLFSAIFPEGDILGTVGFCSMRPQDILVRRAFVSNGGHFFRRHNGAQQMSGKGQTNVQNGSEVSNKCPKKVNRFVAPTETSRPNVKTRPGHKSGKHQNVRRGRGRDRGGKICDVEVLGARDFWWAISSSTGSRAPTIRPATPGAIATKPP